MCDLVFLCRGGRVTAHKAFLTGLSPLLTKMFDISRQFQASDTVYISLPGVDDLVMKQLMTYIYTGNLANTSNTTLSEMKECARSLELEVKMKEEAAEDWRSPGKAGKSRGRAGPASSKKKKPDNDVIKIDIEEIKSAEP